jgi:hypothetical protein
MRVQEAEVLGVLRTFVDPVFEVAARNAESAVRAGVSLSRSQELIPRADLIEIYRTRLENPSLRPSRALAVRELLDALGRSSDDGWYLYTIGEGTGRVFAVFAAGDRTGRACLEF